MTQAVASLLAQVEKLSETERSEFRELFVQQHGEDDISGEITDEDITEMSRLSFQRLDEEENAAGTP